jgi:DNA-binding response OmpR family regulator
MLPWYGVQQARSGKSRMSPAKTDDFEAGPTVLVIDDDEAVRSSLEMLLEAYGYQVMLARDGRQGLAAFRANIPEIIGLELAAAAEKTARLQRELDAIHSTLARSVELLLATTGRKELAVDFLNSLGHPRPALH